MTDQHMSTGADHILPMESEREAQSSLWSNDPSTVREFDPMEFGGFDGFKSILSDDLEPIPGAPTFNCRKAHPLRLKRKPKMRIPFPLPKVLPLPDFDVEPYMCESFPEQIDWSKQHYQETEETRETLKPKLFTWDYVPPYDKEFADEFDRIASVTPEKFLTNKLSLSDYKKLPKFYHKKRDLDENDFVDLLDKKDRHNKFQEWLANIETDKTNELVEIPFDGDWQKEQGKEWEKEKESYGYGNWGGYGQSGYEEKDVDVPFDEEQAGEEGAKIANQEGVGLGQRGGIAGWDRGSRGGRGGWARGRGFSRGGDRGRGFRGGFRGRGFFRGGDNSRGFARGRGGWRGDTYDDDDDDDFKRPNLATKLSKTLGGVD